MAILWLLAHSTHCRSRFALYKATIWTTLHYQSI